MSPKTDKSCLPEVNRPIRQGPRGAGASGHFDSGGLAWLINDRDESGAPHYPLSLFTDAAATVTRKDPPPHHHPDCLECLSPIGCHINLSSRSRFILQNPFSTFCDLDQKYQISADPCGARNSFPCPWWQTNYPQSLTCKLLLGSLA